MSHEITIRKNGFAEMAYAGDTPWHGLGQKVVRGAPIEDWRVAAGLDYTFNETPAMYQFSTAQGLTARSKVPGKKVIFRSDTFAPMAVVGSDFKVVQPETVLEFFRDLTEKNGFNIETAGSLFGGKRIWALAHIGDDADIVPGDKIGGYLLLVTGTDGTKATEARYTTVRVVCNNTLSMACGEGKADFRVTHKQVFNPFDAKVQLGLAHDEFAAFRDNMKRLSDKQVSLARAERIAFDLLKPDTFDLATDKVDKVTNSRAFKSIITLFDGAGKGSNMDGVKGTAWGFVNAVTEYADYFSRATSSENRLNNAWFGAGDELKTKAVNLALATL